MDGDLEGIAVAPDEPWETTLVVRSDGDADSVHAATPGPILGERAARELEHHVVFPRPARIELAGLLGELEIGRRAAGVDIDVDTQAAAEVPADRILQPDADDDVVGLVPGDDVERVGIGVVRGGTRLGEPVVDADSAEEGGRGEMDHTVW